MNPYGILGTGLLWLASLFVVGFWQYDDGRTTERAKWEQRDAEDAKVAAKKILDLETAARKTEAAHAQAIADTSAKYQKDIANVTAEKDRVIADLRSGSLILRDPAAVWPIAGSSNTAAPAPGASGCDGGTGGRLSETTAEFLVSLASEADQVVQQLGACQAVITADRKE